MKDLKDKKFGMLTAIVTVNKSHGRYRWLCKCDCGAECAVVVSELTSGRKTSCGCVSHIAAGFNNVIRRYKLQAEERGFEWKLTRDEAMYLMQKPCFYCDGDLSNTDSGTQVKYNGIDRLDSKKGYIRSNCVGCCVWCNRAKGNRTGPEFARWIDKLYHHYLRDPS